MLAKLVLFALLCLVVLAFYKGAKKIIRLISKGDGCNCSKTGESICHCHDNDKGKRGF